jgi:hypothetical protein
MSREKKHLLLTAFNTVVAVLTMVIVSSLTLRAQERMQSGVWELVTSGEVDHAETRCVSASEAGEVNGGIENVRAALQKRAAVSGCDVVHLKVEGNTISYDASCNSNIMASYKMVYHGSFFDVEVRGRAQQANEEPSTRIKGKRLRPCP